MEITKRKAHMGNSKTFCSACLVIFVLILPVTGSRANEHTNPANLETYTVTLATAENGSYTIDPKIPADGKVEAGTVLTVKATAASN